MPKINQALLDRLADKLRVTKAQVYVRIQHVQNQTFLDRHIAALKLAADEGINIHKYSTPEERNQSPARKECQRGGSTGVIDCER